MSTTTPTTTTTDRNTNTGSPSSTASHADADTATLYLFTFLATILILVLLSASLVLRSYVLRRRYRQRLHQALADGLFTDLGNGAGQFNTLGGFRRSARRLGPKPLVFETWLHPANKLDVWPSIMPVALRCSPPLSPPSSVISSPQPSRSPSSPQARPPFFSQLRIPSPFSLSPRPSSPPSSQGQSPIHLPAPQTSRTRSPPPAGLTSPDSATRVDNGAATLALCVLVAMPDASSPIHHPAPDAKGKGVDPHAHKQGPDADPLLPPSLSRTGTRRSIHEGLPLLEFGVVNVSTGDWVWRT